MCFKAERIFRPLDNEGTGCEMQVVYHYEDERGTVRDGPMCGPWKITAAQSASDGLQHPASPEMTTLLLEGGPSAWCSKQTGEGLPCAAELFLHHGEHLRLSVGVIHNKEGELIQASLIREDARGPWPSADWSSSTEAEAVDGRQLLTMLTGAGAPIDVLGRGSARGANLDSRALVDVAWASTQLANTSDDDALVVCADGRVAIVAPRRRPLGAAFGCSAAWWPSVADGSCQVLYLVEARWDSSGALEAVSHLTFQLPQ